jgi:hypothetical protein
VTTVLRPIGRLADAVEYLAAEEIDPAGDGELADDLVAMRRLMDRLEAEFIRRVQRFDRSHGAQPEGAVNTVSWLRASCRLTGSAAAERVRMARVLADLPRTTESFRSGRAGFTNVSLIARLAEDVGAAAVAGVEDTLVAAAEMLDAGRMHVLTAFTRYRLDADGAVDEDQRNHERRWFSCDQVYGGVFVLRGELDAEGGLW